MCDRKPTPATIRDAAEICQFGRDRFQHHLDIYAFKVLETRILYVVIAVLTALIVWLTVL